MWRPVHNASILPACSQPVSLFVIIFQSVFIAAPRDTVSQCTLYLLPAGMKTASLLLLANNVHLSSIGESKSGSTEPSGKFGI